MRSASQLSKFKGPRTRLVAASALALAMALGVAPARAGPAVATDADQALSFETLGRRLAHEGDREGAGRAMGQAVPYLRRLLAADPANPERTHDLAVALLFSGYQQRIAGGGTAATSDLEEGARLRRTLANPDHEDARTLDFEAAALSALGDDLAERGELSGARQADEEAHGLFARLAAANPGNARLAVMNDATLGALADALTAQGDLPAARAAYDELLLDVRVQARARPDSVDARLALAVTLRDFAESAIAQGDLAAARRTVDESLAEFQALTDASPTDLALKADVDRALNDLGDILVLAGDTAGARRAYLRALTDEPRYTSVNTGTPPALIVRATTLGRLGALDGAQGGFERGRKALAESQDILGLLPVSATGDAAAQALAAFDANAMGEVLTGLGTLPAAEEAFGKDLAISRRLAEASRLGVAAPTRLIEGLVEAYAVERGRGEVAAAQARLAEARATVQRLGPAGAADPRIAALSAAVSAFTMGGARVGWPAVAARTEFLFRSRALPRLDLAWLAAVRARAAHRSPPLHPRPKTRRRRP